jgi:hypothetical protein
MSGFPASTVTPPSGLTNGQFQYLGLTFGGLVRTNPYVLQSVAGLDVPAFVSGDVKRALDNGEWQGVDLAGGRDITIAHVTTATSQTTLGSQRRVMGAVMAPAGTAGEQPLWIQRTSGLYVAMARPRKHNYTLDIETELGFWTRMQSMFHCTDWRCYGTPTASTALSRGGTVNITNGGNVPMGPVVVFTATGVANVLTIRNNTLAGSPVLIWNVSMASGDTVTVDLDAGTAVLNHSGTLSSVASTLDITSTWWLLQPGVNNIYFSASTVNATAAIQYASAFASL